MKNIDKKILLTIVPAIILPLLLVSFIRIAGFSAENSVDCYYHVQMADMGPATYMSKEFPFLTMSTWTDGFSNKELGFHLILSGIRGLKNLINADMGPPFDFESIIFAYFAILGFVFALWYFKTKNILYFSLLFVSCSPFFMDRMLMLRPHNISIILMLLSIPLFSSIKLRSHLWKASLFAFVTAWCYSNPHFILMPAIAFGVVRFLKNDNRQIAWMLPLAVLAGLILGLTLHPQFPNTFINWKIQCIDVVLQALFGIHSIRVGMEFQRPGLIWILKNAMPFLFFLFDLYLIKKLTSRQKPLLSALRDLPVHISACGLIAFISLCGVFAGIRVIEYACPFSILFTALVFNEYSASDIPFPWPFRGKKIPGYSKILLVVWVLACLVFQTENYRSNKGFSPLDDFSLWVKNHDIPENTVIANLIWSDFSLLIYSCPQFRYLSGLDPMFSYAAFPEETEKLEKFRTSRLDLTPKEISEITGADYAFLRKYYKRYAENLKKKGFVPIYEGKDGWLFDLRKLNAQQH